jgi:hypothetical protein
MRNIDSSIIMSFLENYASVLISVLTIKQDFNPELNELDPLEKMELESSSFQKSLTYTSDYEKIIRPFLHGNPFNIGLKLKTHGLYKTLPPFNIINSSKPNNAQLIFYLSKKQSNEIKENFTINITNKIEIEWLFNTLPFYYKPSNFKNQIVKKINKNTYKTYELYGNLFDEFCVKLANKWSIQNIPFDSTELPILKEFIRNLKKN